MIAPELIQQLNDLPSEDLRLVIATAAGIHAHRDGDNGEVIAQALARIAARLALKARTAA